ncbi:MAG: substrate-binding domain-containing protein [Planctomycetes bacterium]|nr:substrate-binding domain-containing protein [Planctomycetota bacterium]
MKIGFAGVMLLSILAIAGLIFLLDTGSDSSLGSGEPLVLYCAAGIRLPVADVMAEYTKEYGVTFQTKYAGSGALLSDLRVGEGDLYLAADVYYLDQARKKKLVREIFSIARQSPALAVRKGNPKNIRGLDDLKRSDVEISLANPEIAAISRVAKKLMHSEQLWNDLWSASEIHRDTVNAVANDIKMEISDAGIVWDATAMQYEELEIVPVPEFENSPNQITIGILETSEQPTRALHFARYLTAPEKGARAFKKHGYRVIEGDKWAESPEIHIFAGGLNRLAIEQTVVDFKKREGVEVLTTYNGCGILIGQMIGGEHPDLYFSCDISFMDQVQDLFINPTNVSKSDMVIITEKGNPKQIAGLEDLAKPGLKVALCDPQQSALGSLTDQLLKRRGIQEKVLKNRQVTSPTADNLVQFIVVGKMDAAVVYKANTVLQADKLEVIPIDDPTAVAVQPIAVGKDSEYPQLSGRLMEAIMSAESKKMFDKFGFEWMVEQNP